jgi:prophage antirepressor-like protein
MTPTLYHFQAHAVRVVHIDGSPWFVAADCAKALGLTVASRSGMGAYLSHLHQSERITAHLGRGNRGNPNVLVITESGLYKLIMRSDKPEARQFQDWVTQEVLPSLRKHGAYVVGQEKVATGEMAEEELMALTSR